MSQELENVKSQQWFYEFKLPDGTITESYLPEIARKIHVTRENALRGYLSNLDNSYSTALDISCHEGFFSLILEDYFKSINGVDKNENSLKKAQQITKLLGKGKIKFHNSALESWNEKEPYKIFACQLRFLFEFQSWKAPCSI